MEVTQDVVTVGESAELATSNVDTSDKIRDETPVNEMAMCSTIAEEKPMSKRQMKRLIRSQKYEETKAERRQVQNVYLPSIACPEDYSKFPNMVTWIYFIFL